MTSSNRAASRRRGQGVLALAAVLALTAAACDSDREDLVSPYGGAILRFNISSDLTTGFPGGTFAAAAGEAGTIDTIKLTVRNLAALNGVYQVWVLNSTGQVASPVGDWVAMEPDAGGDPVQVGSGQGRSFNAGTGRTITFTTNSALAGMDLSQTTHVFVSIESSEASAPSTAQPLWGQHAGADGAPASGNLSFGTFDLGEEPVAFSGSAAFGEGAFAALESDKADLFRARLRNLPLPPVGYFYEGYLRTEDGATEISTGELTTEYAEGFRSLRDVDVDRTLSNQIAPTRIIESAIRATVADVGREFAAFDQFVLKLRPKSSTESGPTVLIGGGVPDGVKRQASSGSD